MRDNRKRMMILTENPCPGLHLVPVIDDIDTGCETNQLAYTAHKSETKHHSGAFMRLSYDIVPLLLLNFKLCLQVSKSGFSTTLIGDKRLFVKYD